MDALYRTLMRYPQDELYGFAEFTQEEKNDFEELGEKLRKVGWGIGMQVSGSDWKAFIDKAEMLVELHEHF